MSFMCRIKKRGRTSLSVENCTSETELKRQWKFDKCFSSQSTQDDIFEAIGAPLAQELSSRKNSLLLVVGPSKSGKTYTLVGTPDEPGILPKLLDTLFNSISSSISTNSSENRDPETDESGLREPSGDWELVPIPQCDSTVLLSEKYSYRVAVSLAALAANGSEINFHTESMSNEETVRSTAEAFKYFIRVKKLMEKAVKKSAVEVLEVILYQDSISSSVPRSRRTVCSLVDCRTLGAGVMNILSYLGTAFKRNSLSGSSSTRNLAVPQWDLVRLLEAHMKSSRDSGSARVICCVQCLADGSGLTKQSVESLMWCGKLLKPNVTQGRSIEKWLPSTEHCNPSDGSWLEGLRAEIQASLMLKKRILPTFFKKQDVLAAEMSKAVKDNEVVLGEKIDLVAERENFYDEERRLAGENKQLERRMAELNKRNEKYQAERAKKRFEEEQLEKRDRELKEAWQRNQKKFVEIWKLTETGGDGNS